MFVVAKIGFHFVLSIESASITHPRYHRGGISRAGRSQSTVRGKRNQNVDYASRLDLVLNIDSRAKHAFVNDGLCQLLCQLRQVVLVRRRSKTGFCRSGVRDWRHEER